jgi:hypothetical protein
VIKGAEAFNDMVGDNHGLGTHMTVRAPEPGKRANYNNADKAIAMGAGDTMHVMAHELGHYFEMNSPEVQIQAIMFWQHRTGSDPFVNMAELYPGHGYEADEYTKKDNFPHPYMGKVYYGGGEHPHETGKFAVVRTTEIMSMGIEEMVRNPAKFMLKDPEYFEFVVDMLRGFR